MGTKLRWKVIDSPSGIGFVLILIVAVLLVEPLSFGQEKPQRKHPAYTGSSSCRECHEKFYKLWAPSHHGLAMQPYTDEFAQKELIPQKEEVAIGTYRYKAKVQSGEGYVLEKGPDGEKKYPISYALGGKNVYYFLAPMERGRLQTLPVAYDVRKKNGMTRPRAACAISPIFRSDRSTGKSGTTPSTPPATAAM